MSSKTPSFPLAVHGLAAGYQGHCTLEGLDWHLEPGSAFGVVGPSGGGKTLFLKVLAGLVAPIAGEVRFHGKALSTFTREERKDFRRRVAMTFQKDGLFDSMTCAQNLDFPLSERTALTAKERARRIDQSLEEVGLSGQGALLVHEMSGGMQKRLGIARALLFSPEVVLYDEPSAGLDPITSQSILELVSEMRKAHQMSVVLVTSELAKAETFCDTLGLLWQGKFEEVGTASALMRSKNPATHQFFHALGEGPLSESFG
jgi:phospholipid/cholesterol/gamma-HCH transport system ATP-binding protein